MNKVVFASGATGQDFAYLAKHLLGMGYRVIGGARRSANQNLWRLETLGIKNKVEIVDFDLQEQSNIVDVIRTYKPDYFYNLAAMSFVKTSFAQPLVTHDINATGVLRILDAIKTYSPETRFYQAGTSEMFGKVRETPQNEQTPFHPRSPYGVSKVAAHWYTVNYRESYNLFCCSAILHNHESKLRGHEFVTRKITMHVAKQYKGFKKPLELGNLNSLRDWGHADEYTFGMIKMMHHDKPDTFVLATGKTYTVRQFVEFAYQVIDRQIVWEGKEDREIGVDKKTGEILVRVNPIFYRPAEVDLLLGDASKAKNELGWEAKTFAPQLAEEMVKFDISIYEK